MTSPTKRGTFININNNQIIIKMKTIVNVVYMIFFWTSYGLAIVFIGIFFARLCLTPSTLTLTDFAWLFMCIVMISQLMIHMTRHPHKKFFELPFKNELL